MSDYTHWHVGMKVVCVDDYPGGYEARPDIFEYSDGLDGLTWGRVYTIRAIGPDQEDGSLSVWLDEIHRPLERGYETGYAVERFRPVQHRATDISIFTAMLTGAKEREPA